MNQNGVYEDIHVQMIFICTAICMYAVIFMYTAIFIYNVMYSVQSTVYMSICSIETFLVNIIFFDDDYKLVYFFQEGFHVTDGIKIAKGKQ